MTTRLVWRRSSRCESGLCVEVARVGGGAAVRDAKDPAGPVLSFDAVSWKALLDGIRAGEFDLP